MLVTEPDDLYHQIIQKNLILIEFEMLLPALMLGFYLAQNVHIHAEKLLHACSSEVVFFVVVVVFLIMTVLMK